MKPEPVISPFLWRRRPLELDVKAMQQSENMRAGSARGIETRRGRTPLLAQSKAGQLRAALANGPMTCAELVRATKIPSSHIYPTLRPSLENGHVVQQHGATGIVRYALVEGGCYFAEQGDKARQAATGSRDE